MSQRRLAFPGTQQQAQREVNRLQEFFSGAMNVDTPASELGQDEVVLLKNLIAYQNYCIGRPGCVSLESPGLPEWKQTGETEAHTYFTAEKVGTHISISGANSIDLLEDGWYLVWSDGYNDQITAIIDPGTADKYIVSKKSETRAADATCTIRKPVWEAELHDRKNLIVVQVGEKLYKIDNEFTSYTEIPFNGRSTLALGESRSFIKPDDNDVVIFNAAGIYRVRFVSDTEFYYYQVNTPVPTRKVVDVEENASNTFGRRYTYAYSKIEGRYLRDRFEDGANLVQEIASCKRNGNGLDYGDVFQEMAIGTGSENYATLKSGAAINDDMSNWTAADATFKAEMNGLGLHTITADLSETKDLQEVAAAIQKGLRVFFPGATCEVITETTAGDVRFLISSGKTDGGVISFIQDSSFGTNIADDLLMRSGDSPTWNLTDRYTKPMQVNGMAIPSNGYHLTHLTMFGSKDIGPVGRQEGNIEDFLLHVKDVPAVRVFKGYCEQAPDEPYTWWLIHVYNPEDDANAIYQEDEGSVIRWDDGSENAIEFLTEFYKSDRSRHSYKEYSLYAKAVRSTTKGSHESLHAFCIGANKCGILNQTGHTVEVDSGDYEFSDADIGKLIFWEDGLTSIITAFNDDGTVEVQDSTTRTEQAGAWDHTAAQLAFTNVTAVEVAGYTVLALESDPAGEPPSDDDIGYAVRNSLGELMGFITSVTFINPNVFKIILTNELGFFEGEYDAIYYKGAPPRTFTDTVTDKDLKAKQEDDTFYHWSRYNAPLPSTNIGDISAGFIAVAEPNTNKIIYSARPNTMKFRGGYYRQGVQEDTSIVDTITMIRAFTDRLCAICKRSTWGTSTAQVSSMDNLSIGEKVYVLPVMVQTHKIGCVHVGSIVDIGVGQAIILTSEPALRYFNGREYTEVNIAQDKVMKPIKRLHPFVTCSYDDIGGYRIFGTRHIQDDKYNRLTNDDGTCIRLAIKTDQGNLFSVYDGEDMVWPEPNTKGITVNNDDGYPRQAMLDETTGKWFNISPYLGPEDSGLVESFEDKDGTDPIPEIQFPEARGEVESFMVEHLESHVYLRPYYDLDEIPETGFQDDGFKDGFKINVFAYVDGQVYDVPKILDMVLGGDACFDRTVKGKRVSIKFQFTTSAFKIVSADQWYLIRDTAGAMTIPQRETDEQAIQTEYAEDALLWMSRGGRVTLNRATGELGTGLADPAKVEGPDGVSNSAMEFTGTEEQAHALWGTVPGDFTLQFGFLLPAAPDSIPIPPPGGPDGSEWEGVDKYGGEDTFITLDRYNGWFEFVVDNVSCAYLAGDGWYTSLPGAMAPFTEMGIYYDQDRSAWIFWADGNVIGVIDGNVQVNNFLTALPVSYNPALFAYIDIATTEGKMVIMTMTTADAAPRATGYIDSTGYHDGEP